VRKALAFRRKLKLAEANASFRHSTRAFAAQCAVQIPWGIARTTEFGMSPAALAAGDIFAQVIHDELYLL